MYKTNAEEWWTYFVEYLLKRLQIKICSHFKELEISKQKSYFWKIAIILFSGLSEFLTLCHYLWHIMKESSLISIDAIVSILQLHYQCGNMHKHESSGNAIILSVLYWNIGTQRNQKIRILCKIKGFYIYQSLVGLLNEITLKGTSFKGVMGTL